MCLSNQTAAVAQRVEVARLATTEGTGVTETVAAVGSISCATFAGSWLRFPD